MDESRDADKRQIHNQKRRVVIWCAAVGDHNFREQPLPRDPARYAHGHVQISLHHETTTTLS